MNEEEIEVMVYDEGIGIMKDPSDGLLKIIGGGDPIQDITYLMGGLGIIAAFYPEIEGIPIRDWIEDQMDKTFSTHRAMVEALLKERKETALNLN